MHLSFSRVTKPFFISLFFSLFLLPVVADPFNNNLSSSERKQLESGQVVIRNTGSLKKLCINSTPQTKKILSIMQDLKPAYIAEVIQVRPYKGNENLDSKTESILCNIPGYAGIPYYSERAEKWYELYSSAVITNAKATGGTMTYYADLEMSVFGTVKTQIDIDRSNGNLFYWMKNLNKLRYHDEFTAVEPENMQSVIIVFRDGDNWILYAIGGVDAYKVFFLKDRVETSFMNRITTFCNFVFTKLDNTLSVQKNEQ
jgi:hypothetical protein